MACVRFVRDFDSGPYEWPSGVVNAPDKSEWGKARRPERRI